MKRLHEELLSCNLLIIALLFFFSYYYTSHCQSLTLDALFNISSPHGFNLTDFVRQLNLTSNSSYQLFGNDISCNNWSFDATSIETDPANTESAITESANTDSAITESANTDSADTDTAITPVSRTCSPEPNDSPTKNTQESANKTNKRYIEIMLVADNKFISYYKNIVDVKEYILIIMNQVADYFHDQSIQGYIEIAVVRMIFLQLSKPEFDLDKNGDPSGALGSFCQWQDRVNPSDVHHPNHHDIALLLTRHDIELCLDLFDENNNCDVAGITYLGSACTEHRNCAIAVDDGINFATVIAHTIGHLLGCAHDVEGGGNCASPKLQVQSIGSRKLISSPLSLEERGQSCFIMTHALSRDCKEWSECSAKAISEFLADDSAGGCLLDEPIDHSYPIEDILYGAVYDADTQCKLQFGVHFISASIGGDGFCNNLWCKQLEGAAAASRDIQVADGTACAHDKWCFHGDCVFMGTRPYTTSGGWSEWSSWSQCSRTCGGGVKRRDRSCNNPPPARHGTNCVGSSFEYDLCNTKECDPLHLPYREIQCSEYNKRLFHGELHTWWPEPEPDSENNPCALYCLNELSEVFKMKPRVEDGTRCHAGTRDTCIYGQCFKVGCDWKLGSDIIEDVCGICNGDGTRCDVEYLNYKAGTPDIPFREGELKKITVLKEKTRKVSVVKIKPAANLLVVSSANGKHYYLNEMYDNSHHNPGPKKPSVSGAYPMGDHTHGVYTSPETRREELHIAGPLSEDLALYVVMLENAETIINITFIHLYDYEVYKPSYRWVFTDWSPCSVQCDGGTEISKPSCIDDRNGKVSGKFCVSSPPQSRSRKCNLQPCKFRWKVWEWSTCSGCLFVPGVRSRQVECVKENQDFSKSDFIIVNGSLCCGKAPQSHEICYSVRPCESRVNNSHHGKTKICESDAEMHVITCPTCPICFQSSNFITESGIGTTQIDIKCENTEINLSTESETSPNSGGDESTAASPDDLSSQVTEAATSERRFILGFKHTNQSKTRLTTTNQTTIKTTTTKTSIKTMTTKTSIKTTTTNTSIKTITTKRRMKRFHIFPTKKAPSTVSVGDAGAVIKDYFNHTAHTKLLVAVVDEPDDLALSELDFEQVGDHVPKYVITGEMREFVGEEAQKYLYMLRYEVTKPGNISFLDKLARNCTI